MAMVRPGIRPPNQTVPALGYEDARRMCTMVEIHRCRRVRIEGVTLTNVGFWTLHLHHSSQVRVTGVRIRNPGTAPNSDGIDISGCRGVWIRDCDIDTGDDGICIKTLPTGRSCEDIFVHNCRIRTDCVGLKIGANETYHDVRRVQFSDCTVIGSHRAIGVYTFRGKTIEDVSFENIHFDTQAPLMFTRPIHIDVRRGIDLRDEHPSLGTVQHLRIRGLHGNTNGRCLLTAEQYSELRHILLDDICLRYPCVDDPAIHGEEHGGMQFNPGVPCGSYRPGRFGLSQCPRRSYSRLPSAVAQRTAHSRLMDLVTQGRQWHPALV